MAAQEGVVIRRRHPWGCGYVPAQRRRWSRQHVDVMQLPDDESREVTMAEREDAPMLRLLAGCRS